MGDLLDLAVRVEAAEGPDRELERQIATALGWTEVQSYQGGNIGKSPRSIYPKQRVPKFTSSLDAAMTLIDGETFFHVARFSPGEGPAEAHVYPNRHVGDDYNGIGATPALALTAAALRARATK